MKAFTRRSWLAFATVGVLGVAGCGPDNETEGEKLGKKAGDPGAPAPNTKSEVFTPAKTQQEHFQRTQANQDYMKKKTATKD